MIQKKSQTSNIEDFERIDDSVQPILHLVPPPFISSCCYSVELACHRAPHIEKTGRRDTKDPTIIINLKPVLLSKKAPARSIVH